MRYTKYSTQQSRHQTRRAAIFIDYENLYESLGERLEDSEHPDVLISTIVEELRRYLIEELRTPTGMTFAFGDFSTLQGNGQYILRALSILGVEPIFVPDTIQDNAAEIRLCTAVMDVLHTRDDISTFAIVSGNRTYLPLMQQLKHHGRKPLLATVNGILIPDAISYIGEEVFLDACNLLSDPVRKMLGEQAAPSQPNGTVVRESRVDIEYADITGISARRTLEIIEEHFGQYEEVYLTPLLRKLSELLGEDEDDPKTIINSLEDAGAVWLEKRRGFPYDYTVLLLDADHPEVMKIRQDIFDRLEQEGEDYPAETYGDGYYYDEYGDNRPIEHDGVNDIPTDQDMPAFDPEYGDEQPEEIDQA